MKLHWFLLSSDQRYALTREGSPPEVGAIVEDRVAARRFRVRSVTHLIAWWKTESAHEAEVLLDEVQA